MARRQAPPGSLADRLHSAALHLLRRVRAQDPAAGLTSPAISALSVVVYGGPLGLSALAAAEQVRPPTMPRLVQGLERRGLVRREADPDDGRRQRLVATTAGRRLLEEGRARRVAALEEALAGLSPAERAELLRATTILERIVGPAAPWDGRNAPAAAGVSSGRKASARRPSRR